MFLQTSTEHSTISWLSSPGIGFIVFLVVLLCFFVCFVFLVFLKVSLCTARSLGCLLRGLVLFVFLVFLMFVLIVLFFCFLEGLLVLVCLEPMWRLVQKEFLTDDMSDKYVKSFSQRVPDTCFVCNNVKMFAQRVPDRWYVWNLC